MKCKLLLVATITINILTGNLLAQNKKTTTAKAVVTNSSDKLARPKLMVGIVVDQMRWDYLYRFYDLYKAGGFKRLLNKGFSCDNTMVPYLPTVTACGHTCVYTGSVPAIHGITGNNWFDNNTQKSVYCTEDNNDSIKTVGSNTKDIKVGRFSNSSKRCLASSSPQPSTLGKNTRLRTIINDSVFLIIVIWLITFYE